MQPLKAGVRREEEEDIQSDGVHLAKKPLYMTSPAFLEGAEHPPADGKQQMNPLVGFVCAHNFCFT